jgi:DNA mismatch repair protein MutS2
MGFVCDAATLARFEWPRLLERLAEQASTDRGAEACRQGRFAEDLEGVRALLAETTEARAILDSGEEIPLGGAADLRPILEAAIRGQTQSASDLGRVLVTLHAAHRVRAFLGERAEQAPGLSARALSLPDLRPLEGRLAKAITPDGELRDDATPELRRARRRVRDFEAEVERRMAAILKNPGVAQYLQDRFTTFRNDRPVLPVRADARARVRGIVHDVSSSGTTVFVEPEDVVEVGNRLRMARTELAREIDRILRELTEQIRAEGGPLEALGDGLELLDFSLARGRLSKRLDASAPAVGPDQPLALRMLLHPLLVLEGGLPPEQIVPNDLVLSEGVRGLLISGPNAGGKTVAAKAMGLAAISVRAGLHVPCLGGSGLPLFDSVFADIGDEQDLRAGLSTFSARMANLARIVSRSGPGSLVVVDELGEGTEPGEGAAIAQAMLEALVDRGARVVATTHFNRLKELAGHDPRFLNASAEFDRETLGPTYRIHLGVPGSSGACWVAERMGVPPIVVERARTLLDGEDRKLEALTRSLSELRQELEAERRLASQVRAETEGVRTEYETRLAALRAAREKALSSMKAEVESAFRSARQEIAAVVRDLQRGEGRSGRAANRAHKEIQRIRARTEAVERTHSDPVPAPEPASIDWSAVPAGSRLELQGLPGEAQLLEGPDRKAQILVRAGGLRMTVPVSRVLRATTAPDPKPPPRVDVDRAPESATLREVCDLRGLRVDEALDCAEAHLQRALGTSLRHVVFIHGHGTGALREAIRGWLSELPYIAGQRSGEPREGGNGVTVALLSEE